MAKKIRLFRPLGGVIATPDRGLAAAISGRIGGNPNALTRVYRQQFDVLRQVLFDCAPDTTCPAEQKSGKRSVLNQPASIEAGESDYAADVRDPLRIGSTLSEDFLLEYANGMDGKDLKITMHRLDVTSGTAVWTKPDSVVISVLPAKAATQGQ